MDIQKLAGMSQRNTCRPGWGSRYGLELFSTKIPLLRSYPPLDIPSRLRPSGPGSLKPNENTIIKNPRGANQVPASYFWKDGKPWSYVNVEDELGFAVMDLKF